MNTIGSPPSLQWGATFSAEMVEGFAMGISLDMSFLCGEGRYTWEPQKETGWVPMRSDEPDIEFGGTLYEFNEEEGYSEEWMWAQMDHSEEYYLIRQAGNAQGPWGYTVYRKVKVLKEPVDPKAPLIEVLKERHYLNDSIKWGRKGHQKE